MQVSGLPSSQVGCLNVGLDKSSNTFHSSESAILQVWGNCSPAPHLFQANHEFLAPFYVLPPCTVDNGKRGSLSPFTSMPKTGICKPNNARSVTERHCWPGQELQRGLARTCVCTQSLFKNWTILSLRRRCGAGDEEPMTMSVDSWVSAASPVTSHDAQIVSILGNRYFTPMLCAMLCIAGTATLTAPSHWAAVCT